MRRSPFTAAVHSPDFASARSRHVTVSTPSAVDMQAKGPPARDTAREMPLDPESTEVSRLPVERTQPRDRLDAAVARSLELEEKNAELEARITRLEMLAERNGETP